MDQEQLKKEIGNNIVSLRIRNNLKQSYLAEHIGLSIPTLRAIENGTGKASLTVVQMMQICALCGCHASEIVDHDMFKTDTMVNVWKDRYNTANELIIQLQHELRKRDHENS